MMSMAYDEGFEDGRTFERNKVDQTFLDQAMIAAMQVFLREAARPGIPKSQCKKLVEDIPVCSINTTKALLEERNRMMEGRS